MELTQTPITNTPQKEEITPTDVHLSALIIFNFYENYNEKKYLKISDIHESLTKKGYCTTQEKIKEIIDVLCKNELVGEGFVQNASTKEIQYNEYTWQIRVDKEKGVWFLM